MYTIECLLKTDEMNHQCLWNSRHCSSTFHSVKICSTYKHPCQKPACSSLIFESTAIESLLRRTTQKTLLGTNRSVSPLQFTGLAKFPFLDILMTRPFYHSSETASICQHLFMTFVNSTTTVSSPHFSSYAVIWPKLMALLFFRAFIASHISLVISPRFRVSSWESCPCLNYG